MSGFKPFLMFLDAVSSAEGFIRDSEEYDDLDFRMEILESYLSRLMMIFSCIYRLPNVTKAQIERVSKVLTALINLKTATWIAIQGGGPSHHSTGVNELRRKGIHHPFSEDK